MGQNRGPGQRLLSLWGKLSPLPGGRWAYSRALGWMVPYSGTIGARVCELEPGYARVEMRDRRRVRNHLRSVHAIALMNLGELTTGLALNCGIPSSGRAILVGISMEYLKKARGTLAADCRCDKPDPSVDQEVELTGRILDEAGDTVAVARALWRVGPQPSKKSDP
jgi:acyl-coenzyme A thioesterase PaaI-like protein